MDKPTGFMRPAWLADFQFGGRADSRPAKAAPAPDGDDVPEDLAFVNLTEFAEVEGKSLPTMRKIIDRNPDFPCERRGAKGTDYRIDLAGGLAWMRNHEAEVAEAQERRAEDLRQYKLKIWGPDGLDVNEPGATLTPQQESIQIANRLGALKLAREHDQILMKSDVRQCFAEALGRLREDVQGLSVSLSRDLSLDREQRAKLDKDLAAMLHRLGDALSRPETYGKKAEAA